MAARRKRKRENAELGMDMTPMIDCVFLLIIFFMIVSEFAKLETIAIELPVASEAREIQGKTYVINVKKDGKYVVQGDEYSLEDLNELLGIFVEMNELEENGNSSASVVVRGDVRTKYKHIQDIMIKCMGNRIYKFSFGARVKEE